MKSNSTQKFLNVKEAGEYLGFSHHTIYAWTSQRRIPYFKKGGRLRFDIEALERWMQEDSRDVIPNKGDA